MTPAQPPPRRNRKAGRKRRDKQLQPPSLTEALRALLREHGGLSSDVEVRSSAKQHEIIVRSDLPVLLRMRDFSVLGFAGTGED